MAALIEQDHELTCPDFISQRLKDLSNLVVNNEASYNEVTDTFAQARKLKKYIEEKRKKLVEPYRDRINEINTEAKNLSEPLEQIIDVCNRKIGEYKYHLELEQQEKERQAQAACEIFDFEMEATLPAIAKPLATKSATTVTKTTFSYRVLDISKVPLEYLRVDDAIVQKHLKGGVREIPGLDIYEETTTKLRLR